MNLNFVFGQTEPHFGSGILRQDAQDDSRTRSIESLDSSALLAH